jgi:phospholipase C
MTGTVTTTATTTKDGHGRSIRIPMHLGRSPIKHVFYIIKENRTYDQVFGDMPQGNGDPRS